MRNLKDIKDNIKIKLYNFVIVNSNIANCIDDCHPYEELEDCETVGEIQDWLENYQSNIDDAKQELQYFNDILEELNNELLQDKLKEIQGNE